MVKGIRKIILFLIAVALSKKELFQGPLSSSGGGGGLKALMARPKKILWLPLYMWEIYYSEMRGGSVYSFEVEDGCVGPAPLVVLCDLVHPVLGERLGSVAHLPALRPTQRQLILDLSKNFSVFQKRKK